MQSIKKSAQQTIAEGEQEKNYQKMIGASTPRVDTALKVTGRAIFARDLKVNRMLYAKIKRCPYPHARIVRIDVARALEIPGTYSVVTGKDFPPSRTEDTPPFAKEEVMYANQSVAAVAAENKLLARKAVDSIVCEYEELPAVFDPEVSMSKECQVRMLHLGEKIADSNPNVGKHIKVRRGNVDEFFTKSDFVIENTYTTPAESHWQLEPLTFLAQPDPDGGVTIWGTSTGPNKIQYEVASLLGIDPSLVRGRVSFLGGWFGSKEESHLAAICAMLALRTLRPVKLELTREETVTATGVRHPSKIRIKDGVSREGKIVTREINAIYDGGAYGSFGNIALKNCVLVASSVYNIPNFKMDAYRVYTNRVPGVAKRAPISWQAIWAIECQMDSIAFALNLDPLKFRLNNLLRAGEENSIGEVMEDIRHDEALLRVTRAIGWERKREPQNGPWKFGKGIAIGVLEAKGGVHEAAVRVKSSGKVEVWTDVVENGQGILTGVAQVVADEFGIPIEDVVLIPLLYGSDSISSGLAGGAAASRQLLYAGKALQLACREAKSKIAEEASKRLNIEPDKIDVRNKRAFVVSSPEISVQVSELFGRVQLMSSKLMVAPFLSGGDFVGFGSYYRKTGELDPQTGMARGGPVSPFYVTVAQAAEVGVNTETGQVRVRRIVAAMDVGKAINPQMVRYQIYGSVAMGLSETLGEELQLFEGSVTNAALADYKIMTSLDIPEIEPLILEIPHRANAFGAKSAGEPSIIPTAPAVRNAVHDAVGIWIDDLPITAEKVLDKLGQQQQQY